MTVKVSLSLRILAALQSLLHFCGKSLVLPLLRLIRSKASHPSEEEKQTALTLGVSTLFHLFALFLAGSAIVMTSASPKAQFQASALGQLDTVADASDTHEEEEIRDPLDAEPAMDEASGGNAGDDSGGDSGGPDPLSGAFLTLPSPGASGSFALSPSLNSMALNSGAGSGGGSGNGSGSGRGGSGKGKKLYGMDVQTTNQGILVVFDTSGSMEPLAAKVRATVEENFPDATVVTAKGALFATEKTMAKMRKERGASDFYTGYYSSMLEYSLIPQVNRILLTRPAPPESIYFFSDFADFVDSTAVKEFSQLLLDKKIKFFAHSVGKEPDPAITRLCKSTGGQELVEK